MHMAMVMDKDGNYAGLVTLDDVLDELLPASEGGSK